MISCGVSQRIHEISISMALDAQERQVLRHMLRQGSMLVSLGVVLGLGGANAAAHTISPVLFGVDPGDLRVYGVVTLVLGTMGFDGHRARYKVGLATPDPVGNDRLHGPC